MFIWKDFVEMRILSILECANLVFSQIETEC